MTRRTYPRTWDTYLKRFGAVVGCYFLVGVPLLLAGVTAGGAALIGLVVGLAVAWYKFPTSDRPPESAPSSDPDGSAPPF
jgi:hypothetical protein